jgi:hypothetical protein
VSAGHRRTAFVKDGICAKLLNLMRGAQVR